MADRVFIQNDNDQESWLETVDKLTGKTLVACATSGAQHLVHAVCCGKAAERTELVTIGLNKVRSYAVEDGALLWEISGTAGLVSQIPLSKHGLLYAGAGYHYGPLYAIKPGAKGDITLTGDATSNEFIAWSQKRGSSIHPGYLISGETALRVLRLRPARLLQREDGRGDHRQTAAQH
jgi:ribosomal protein L32